MKVYTMPESYEQEMVFAWAELMATIEPRLELLHHIPNGGYRHPATAARMKSEGVKAGVPDICLPVAAKGYHGLYIEMKKADGSNRPSNQQRRWIRLLTKEGYKAEVAYGADEAIDILRDYLQLNQEAN